MKFRKVPVILLGLFLILGAWMGNSRAGEDRKLLLVITTDEVETVWQALRLANFALSQGDEVRIYLTGKGVKTVTLGNEPLDVARKLENFLDDGGEVYG